MAFRRRSRPAAPSAAYANYLVREGWSAIALGVVPAAALPPALRAGPAATVADVLSLLIVATALVLGAAGQRPGRGLTRVERRAVRHRLAWLLAVVAAYPALPTQGGFQAAASAAGAAYGMAVLRRGHRATAVSPPAPEQG